MEGKDYYGDYSLLEVPGDKRRSFASLFLVVTGINCCVPALFAGSALGSGLTLSLAIVACLIGFGITGVLGGFQAMVGGRHGVATVFIGRQIFGRWGTGVLAIFMVITGVGWFAMNTGFFGQIMSALVPGHFLTTPVAASIWGGILMIITAAIGFKGLAFLSFLAVPLFLVVLVASLGALTSGVGLAGLFSILPAQPMPLAGAITMMAGAMAMGAVIAPDVTRYARRDKDAFFSWFLGIWLMNTIIVGIGAALMLGSGQPNLPMAMLGIGLGAGALMIVILGQWTTNDNNLYSSALSFMNLVPWTKWKLTVVFGVIGTALAAAGAINYFVDYLTLLGTYVPAVGAVMLADYYIVRRYMDGIVDKKRYEFGEGAKYKMVNVPAIVCFIVGGYVGSKIPGITTVNAVLLTMAIYLLCVFACKKLHVPYQFGEATEGKKGF